MPPKAEVDWPKLGNGRKLNLQDGVFQIPKGVLEAPNAGVLEEPSNSEHARLVESEAGLLVAPKAGELVLPNAGMLAE